jgi:hypothetical protein
VSSTAQAAGLFLGAGHQHLEILITAAQFKAALIGKDTLLISMTGPRSQRRTAGLNQ